MDRTQAKEILAAYRPGKDDASDPAFAEALELAKRDAELSRWLDDQARFDSALRERFATITVPLGLRTRILAQAKTAAPVWWRMRPAMIGFAVGAIVLAGLCFYLFTSGARLPKSLVRYQQAMSEFAASDYKPNIAAKTHDALRLAFAKEQWPSDYIVPHGLASVRVEGGYLMWWHDEKVSMLCMKGEKDKGIWLFVVNRTGFPKAPQIATPQFAQIGRLTTATWSDGGEIYLLASEGDVDQLKRYL